MSCVAFSVGLGNIWRFPYTAYENGGGAFLVPYIIVLFIIGKPIYYMEMILGQFSSRSCIQVWSISPAFRGISIITILSIIHIQGGLNKITISIHNNNFFKLIYRRWKRCAILLYSTFVRDNTEKLKILIFLSPPFFLSPIFSFRHRVRRDRFRFLGGHLLLLPNGAGDILSVG